MPHSEIQPRPHGTDRHCIEEPHGRDTSLEHASEIFQPSSAPVIREDNHANAAWLFASAVFILLLGCFVATSCRTVFWWDSGELAANARVLGIAHRPGFPLYILVAHLFGLVPFGDYFYRINFLSALSGAASLAIIGYIVARLGSRWWRQSPTWEVILAAALTVVGIAGSYTFWIQSVRAEVYAPNLLVVCILLIALWRFDDVVAGDRREAKRWICFAGLISGLGMALHHATFASVLPAVLLLMLWRARRYHFAFQTLVLYGVFAVLGASVYLYMPIRALQDPALNWGWVHGVKSPDWSAVAATDAYHYLTATTLIEYYSRLKQILNLFVDQLQWALIALAVLGIWHWWVYRRRWLFTALGMLAGNFAVTALLVTDFTDTNADIHGYLLPSLIAAFFLIAGGSAGLFRRMASAGERFVANKITRHTIWAAVAFVLILMVITPGMIYHPFCNLSQNRLAYDFGVESISHLMPGSIVMLKGTNWDFVLRGLRYGNGWRPDLIVINRDLMPAAWYRHWLFQNHPELASVDIPQDSTGLKLKKWGISLAQHQFTVYWEFTERDMDLTPQIVPAGHLFELQAQPVDVLAPSLLAEQEEFERSSKFYGSPEQVMYDFDAKMVWVMNLYRAGMYYESRGLYTRAKALYERALSISPYESKILMAYMRVSPSGDLPRTTVYLTE